MNLSDLIDTHKGRRSYPELSRDCGGAPTGKRIQQLVRDPIKNFPDPPTVVALAKGLRVPQRVVVLAAAESLGLDVHDTSPRVLQLMPGGAGELSEEQAAAVAHLVDVIVNDPVRQLGSMEAAEPAEDKSERREASEPTVLEVRRRQAEERAAEELDALPPESDDPAPRQTTRPVQAAARKKDKPK